MPRDVPIDVSDASDSVIRACREAQGGEIDVVPITAIDEAEMPKRLGKDVDQDTWDRTRAAIRSEIESEGYTVD